MLDICAISRIENHAVGGLKFRPPRSAFPTDRTRIPARSVPGAPGSRSQASPRAPTFRPVNHHGHIVPTRLSAHAVALVLKRHAARAGLDPDEVAGHSLRAGLATSAAAAGVPERVIAEQTGHKGTTMLRRYIREGSLFRENAASAVGL
jgi:integrase